MNRREWTPANTQHVSQLRPADSAAASVEQLASFAVEHVDDAVVVQVSGEIDMLTTPRLHDLLVEVIQSGPRVVVLDLAAVSFFASSGLATLVESRERAEEQDVRLHIAAPSGSVRRPLQITGLYSRFEIFPDRESALAP